MKTNSDIKSGLIFLLIPVVILLGIIWFNRAEEGADAALLSPNVLAATEPIFDFGGISMAAGKVSHAYKIKNSSSGPVTINKVYTSCMCTVANLIMDGKKTGPFGMPGHGFSPTIKIDLQPGQEAEVEAVFDPAAHGPAGIGPIERVVYVQTEDSEPLVLEFKAKVLP